MRDESDCRQMRDLVRLHGEKDIFETLRIGKIADVGGGKTFDQVVMARCEMPTTSCPALPA
jgi:hypothetical protein